MLIIMFTAMHIMIKSNGLPQVYCCFIKTGSSKKAYQCVYFPKDMFDIIYVYNNRHNTYCIIHNTVKRCLQVSKCIIRAFKQMP